MTVPQLDEAKVAAARLWAATRMPYLASALFACPTRADPGSGTVGVDQAWQVHADPTVVDQFDVPDLGRLLVHLTGHLVRDHAARASALRVADRNTRWWNDCADYEVNDDLRAEPGLASVANGVPGDAELPDGELVETYFADRRESDESGPNRPDRWDCGSGADGVARPWDGDDAALTPSQADLLRRAVAEEIRRQEQGSPGTVPEGWLRWAEVISPARTDWRRVLAAEVRKALSTVRGRSDYAYRRPSRRTGAPTNAPRAVLPSMHQPTPNVAVVCDTSSSMHEGLLSRALAEVEALLSRVGLRTAGITVLAVDADVHSTDRVHRAGQVRLIGGGGTDMTVGIAAAAQTRPRPDVVVVLTDGMTPWPSTPPPGIRIIVGLLRDGPPTLEQWLPPTWARTVIIDESVR